MKKILTFVSIAILTIAGISTASAQERGEQYFNINFGYDTNKSSLSASVLGEQSDKIIIPGGNQLNVGLEYGVFAARNFRISLSAGYGYAGMDFEEFGYDGDGAIHSYKITPGFAYYVRIAPGFYYTPNLNLGFGGITLDVDMDDLYSYSTRYEPSLGDEYYEDDYDLDDNLSMYGFVAELQPIAVEFRPTERFAMSVSLCSLQFATMSGEFLFDMLKLKGNNLSFNLLANAQVGFKLYF